MPLLIRQTNADDTGIFVTPASISNAVTNNDYTVYINISNVVNLYAWEFQLSYNTSILSLVSDSVVPGGLNSSTTTFYSNNSAGPNTAGPTNYLGHLWWSVSNVYPATGITYNEHEIFQIVFEAISVGTSSLYLYGTILVDSNGNQITPITTTSGSITVGSLYLTVTSIDVPRYDQGISIYANDTFSDGKTPYYVPVIVTIQNTGTMTATNFNVSLAVYSITYSKADGYAELNVPSLANGTSLPLEFRAVFHPTHYGYYSLTATVDCHDVVVKSNTNTVLTYSPGIKVTVIGDIVGNGGPVNVLDAVIIAQAWTATATPQSSNWNIKADIVHDNGPIGILDATRIGLHWGQTS